MAISDNFWQFSDSAVGDGKNCIFAIKLINNKHQKMEPKKLYRSKADRKIAGVCAGLAEYFNIDPTIVRLAWLVAVICGGVGLLAYIIAWIVVPEYPYGFR